MSLALPGARATLLLVPGQQAPKPDVGLEKSHEY